MVEFNLALRVDPAGVEAGVKRAVKSLSKIDSKANDLRQTMRNAMAIKTGSVESGAKRAVASLNRVSDQANQTRLATRDALKANSGSIVNASKRASTSLRGVETRANSTGAALRRAFALFGGVMIARNIIKTMSSFGQSMATVQAVTKATAADFEELTKKALDLGIKTRFSATDAADALVNLSRAGFSTKEALASVAQTLSLAQAGGLGLSEAADITASSLRGFRIEATESGRVTDVLTVAANSANTTVGQLGEGIKFVAPIAAGLGVSFENTSAALGILSDSGLKASLAGTGLRRVMAEMEAPGEKLQQILARVGKTGDDVRVSQVGLSGALKALQAAGIDTGEALEAFGQRGGPAFEILVNNIPNVEKFTEKLKDAKGAAAEAAATMDNTLQGALLRVQSAWKGMSLAAAEAGTSRAMITGLDALALAMREVAAAMGSLITTALQIGAAFATWKIGGYVLGLRAASVAAQQASVANAAFAVTEAQMMTATVASMRATVGKTTATIAAIEAEMAWRTSTVAQTALLAKKTAATALLTKQTVALAGATKALAASEALATTTGAGMARGMRKLKSSVLGANGAMLAGAAVLFVLNKKQEKYLAIQKDIAKDRAFNEQAQMANHLGAKILNARVEMEKLEDRQTALANKDIVNPHLDARILKLKAGIASLTVDLKKSVSEFKTLDGAVQRQKTSIENTLTGLDKRAELLRKNSDEAEKIVEIEETIERLLNAGINPDAKTKALIATKVKLVKQLEDERDMIDSIRGPQQKLAQNIETLRRARQRGSLTIEEYRIKLAQLNEEQMKTVNVDPFKAQLDSLKEANNLLMVRLAKGEQAAEVERMAMDLAKKQTPITEKEKALLGEQLTLTKSLSSAIERKDNVEKDYVKTLQAGIAAKQGEKDRINDIAAQLDYVYQLKNAEAELNAVLLVRPDLVNEVNRALEDMKLQALESSDSLGDGFTRAFMKIKREASDMASVAEAAVNSFADRATDALVTFAETGKFSFKEFTSALLKDITRIIARLLIVKALSAAFGGVGGGSASAVAASSSGSVFGGGKAAGGPVSANRSYLVGEDGPEIFNPGRSGNITPNKDIGKAMAAPVAPPQVNVQVVNVSDPNEIPQAIESGSSDEAIINALARNPDRIRQVLQ